MALSPAFTRWRIMLTRKRRPSRGRGAAGGRRRVEVLLIEVEIDAHGFWSWIVRKSSFSSGSTATCIANNRRLAEVTVGLH
jgi:hypothetical protein